MTPTTLAKIRAIAEDERGHPEIRARAREMLKRFAPTVQPQRVNPGMQTSQEYQRFRFMDPDLWGETANGNQTKIISHNGKRFRIVLFKHKKSPTYGWMRINIAADLTEFGERYKTLEEAREAAWDDLMTL